ncbi:MAG: peptidoglycan binding domain-containing protein, partial [Eubacterium sp.]|nr:peptidoglycan binding domain-containing protein [Eubacterium sp.]
SDHFYPKTSINGVDVSMKSRQEAEKLLGDHLSKYLLGIKSPEGTMMISAQNCSLAYTGIEEIRDLLDNQEEAYWFRDIFAIPDSQAMGLRMDEEKLRETMEALPCMTPSEPQAPVDARIKYDDSPKDYVIVDEIIGNTIDKEVFFEALKEAILAGQTEIDLSTNAYYVQPKYKAMDDTVQKAKATLDKYMGTVINYEDSGCSYTLDRKDIHTFLHVSKDFKITFDKEYMKQYITEKLSPVFNTVGKTRTITSPGSGTFTISGGFYGWQVGLIDERAAMIDNIKAGATVTREPMYLQDAARKDRENDIGDSYIDASISDQHLWVVVNGKVTMQSDFVSGDTSKGRDTDKGVYMIEKKQRNYSMRENPVTVSYWLPFNLDLGEGFHDASWRKGFGGKIYTYNGSHGCINLPPAFAKKLYESMKVGFPVIIH